MPGGLREFLRGHRLGMDCHLAVYLPRIFWAGIRNLIVRIVLAFSVGATNGIHHSCMNKYMDLRYGLSPESPGKRHRQHDMEPRGSVFWHHVSYSLNSLQGV